MRGRLHGPVGIRSIEKSNGIENRSHGLLAYMIVPQPTTLPHVPMLTETTFNNDSLFFYAVAASEGY